MAVALDHTIVHARDSRESAELLCDLLGLGPPTRFGPFLVVELANRVSLDFIDAGPEDEIHSQHYSFLVTEPEFDQIWGRIRARGLTWYADPAGDEPGQIYELWGGRGLYWSDPVGNWLEIQTVPYGGWPDGGPGR
jgi:extradiol dioxygenase family protein